LLYPTELQPPKYTVLYPPHSLTLAKSRHTRTRRGIAAYSQTLATPPFKFKGLVTLGNRCSVDLSYGATL
jgi:hypothetical protein